MGLYERHFSNPQRERAFLSAVGFTTAFATARGITHAIKAGVGPFHNISEGGTHIHHSHVRDPRAAGDRVPVDLPGRSLVSASAGGGRRGSARATYGIAAALTLDEFALWLDLHDDYWDKQGRKSIDAVAIFGGLLGIGFAGRGALKELGLLPRRSSASWTRWAPLAASGARRPSDGEPERGRVHTL